MRAKNVKKYPKNAESDQTHDDVGKKITQYNRRRISANFPCLKGSIYLDSFDSGLSADRAPRQKPLAQNFCQSREVFILLVISICI